jgi:hypothetical protein
MRRSTSDPQRHPSPRNTAALRAIILDETSLGFPDPLERPGGAVSSPGPCFSTSVNVRLSLLNEGRFFLSLPFASNPSTGKRECVLGHY